MRRGYTHLFPLISILLLSSAFSYGQSWSGILAPARATDWTQAGIPGGIPSGTWANCVTTQCNTVNGGTVTTSSLNSALSSAPNNTVVRVPAGSFTLNGNVSVNRSNVALRGAGPTQTTIVLNGNSLFAGVGSGGQGSTPGGLASTPLSSLALGSTVLTVGSTTGMSAGQQIVIYEANDAYINTTGDEGNQNASYCPSPSLNFFGCSTRYMAEMVQIVTVNSGTQITITAPGLTKTYASGLTPQVFFWNQSSDTNHVGFENMNIDSSATGAFSVDFVFCHYCWAKNLSVIHAGRAGIYSLFSYRDEIRDSYISESNSPGAPTEYGIECDHCYWTKIENNIMFGITSPFVTETAQGTVLGYNYTLNTAVDNLFPTFDTHRAHSNNVLYEGNVTSNVNMDFVWGSASGFTIFRNYIRGTDPNKQSNYRTPIDIEAWQHFLNIVGNVLGDPSIHTTYVCDQAHPQGTDNFVYGIGWQNNCLGGGGGYDTVSESSLMRWGNWDSATWLANGSTNGIRFCTGSGAGNSACTASETASTDPTFPGLANPSTSLPASFYNGVTSPHASCGTGLSFWKSAANGTCPIYPPIGPDATCTTNCIANTASHAAQIPAQICYNKTAKDANGFLTAFDANACYAADSASNTGPAPPTGLSALVQ